MKPNPYIEGRCVIDGEVLKYCKQRYELLCKGSANRAPLWRRRSDGSLFGGLYRYLASEKHLKQMFNFIAYEAQRVGYVETVNGLYIANPNPYDGNFMDGLPQNEWAYFYEKGSYQARLHRSEKELRERYPK